MNQTTNSPVEDPKDNRESNVIETTTVAKKVSSFVVFWLENGKPQHFFHVGDRSGPALEKCNSLREQAKAGAAITHVCISSDLVDNVTLPGVSDKLPEGYDWKKRRR